MNVLDELEKFQEAALKDEALRHQILETGAAKEPLSAFCKLARDKGFEIYEMDMISAGEEAYAGMRRATNGGGENSPMLEHEDDYYRLFMAAIGGKTDA